MTSYFDHPFPKDVFTNEHFDRETIFKFVMDQYNQCHTLNNEKIDTFMNSPSFCKDLHDKYNNDVVFKDEYKDYTKLFEKENDSGFTIVSKKPSLNRYIIDEIFKYIQSRNKNIKRLSYHNWYYEDYFFGDFAHKIGHILLKYNDDGHYSDEIHNTYHDAIEFVYLNIMFDNGNISFKFSDPMKLNARDFSDISIKNMELIIKQEKMHDNVSDIYNAFGFSDYKDMMFISCIENIKREIIVNLLVKCVDDDATKKNLSGIFPQKEVDQTSMMNHVTSYAFYFFNSYFIRRKYKYQNLELLINQQKYLSEDEFNANTEFKDYENYYNILNLFVISNHRLKIYDEYISKYDIFFDIKKYANIIPIGFGKCLYKRDVHLKIIPTCNQLLSKEFDCSIYDSFYNNRNTMFTDMIFVKLLRSIPFILMIESTDDTFRYNDEIFYTEGNQMIPKNLIKDKNIFVLYNRYDRQSWLHSTFTLCFIKNGIVEYICMYRNEHHEKLTSVYRTPVFFEYKYGPKRELSNMTPDQIVEYFLLLFNKYCLL